MVISLDGMSKQFSAKERGIFCISLDFELYWGIRDKRGLDRCENVLSGVPAAVEGMLRLFESYAVHATWATVGLLFCRDNKEMGEFIPDQLPLYDDRNLSPYPYIDSNDKLREQFHFAPGLIEQIGTAPGQEIATHTFSHYYCLESGQNPNQFCADIAQAVKIAEARGYKLKSLVFPRNQWSGDYLSVLNENDISCFRGNERSWLYRASNGHGQSKVRRIGRLLDAYINLSGSNTYPLRDCLAGNNPYNFPSSRFLRPYSLKMGRFDSLRLRRISNAMESAAKNNEVFHLWWHPHNFGANLRENLDFLESVLQYYKRLERDFGMASLNMGELSSICDEWKS